MEKIISSFGLDWKVFTAEIVNFLIVFSVIYFFVFKKISNILEERQRKIKEGLENSEKAEEKLKLAEKDANKIINEAREEANRKIEDAKNTAQEKANAIIDENKKRGEDIIKKAEEEALKERERIIESSKKELAKIAVLEAEKILQSK